jgi:WD40 repeat protein/energy-coupling factor transporter ATP-binding protein EcfA2
MPGDRAANTSATPKDDHGVAVTDGRFDVFLSYNGKDRSTIVEIADRLRRAKLEPWFDQWYLAGGASFSQEIPDALRASRACAVFVGPNGIGDWTREELALALDRAAKDRDFRAFAVLLPGLDADEPFDASTLPPLLTTRTWVDLRRGVADGATFQMLINAVLGVAGPPDGQAGSSGDADVCPYRGLQVFDEESAEFFFGREADTQRVLEKLKAGRFLVVLGPSGSGKSSLVRAGVVPSLRRGALPGSESWEIEVLTPGAHPLAALAAKLVELHHGDSMQRTVDELARDERSLHLASELALSDGRSQRLLLLVDQLEELFTLCRDDAARDRFLANLLYAATIPQGRLVVLLTMRADFYHRLAAHPAFAAQVASHQFLVSPMDEEGLRRAIEEPAWHVGLRFEEGLVATILDGIRQQPGSLPLLEHVLLELWGRRRSGLLTLEGYRQSGGLEGALAARAEAIYNSFSNTEQLITRRALLRLTEPGEGTEDTRRRAPFNELLTPSEESDTVEHVVNALADARLLTTSRDEASGERMVDVTHEALIRGWPRLHGWVDESRSELRVHRRLTEAAQEWLSLDRDDGALYRGGRLLTVAEWAENNRPALNELEREFLDASRAAAKNELEVARRRNRRLRSFVAALGVLMIAAVAGGVLALHQQRRANAQKQVAQAAVLANDASPQLGRSLPLALLLGVESYRAKATPETRGAVLSLLARLRGNVAIEHRLPVADWLHTAAFSPDSESLATGGEDGRSIIWNAVDGSRREVLGRRAPRSLVPEGSAIRSVSFGVPGTLLSASDAGVIDLWDIATRTRTDRVSVAGHDAAFHGGEMAFSPRADLVAIVATHGVALWQIGRRTFGARRAGPTGRGPEGETAFRTLAFSPDGDTLVTGGYDGVVRLWDVSRGQPDGPALQGQKGWILELAFSHDSRTLASADNVGTVVLWDLRRRHERNRILVPGATANSVAFSSDDSTLAVGTAGAGIFFFDVHSGKPVGEPLRTLDAETVAFSPDGKALAVAGETNFGALLRPLPLGTDASAALQRLCRAAGRNLSRAEWKMYLTGRTYRKTCPQWPAAR